MHEWVVPVWVRAIEDQRLELVLPGHPLRVSRVMAQAEQVRQVFLPRVGQAMAQVAWVRREFPLRVGRATVLVEWVRRVYLRQVGQATADSDF
jgi:hypothetical protein